MSDRTSSSRLACALVAFAAALAASSCGQATTAGPHRHASAEACAARGYAREIDIPAGDHTLHVRIAGDVSGGPPLVAIPGGPGSSFHYLLPLERLVTPSRAVVLVDPRGVA